MDKLSYNHAGLGGTFDRLHLGHHQLLSTAFSTAKHVSIGVTVDSFSTFKSLSQIIEPYEQRVSQLVKYLKKTKRFERTSIFPLVDVFGPTLTDQSIDCLVVTSHTRSGAKYINLERMQRSLARLPIIQASLVKDESGKYISSTRIREGKIDRQGRVFAKAFFKDIHFSRRQKNQLKEPFGPVLSNNNIKKMIDHNNPTQIYVVGDQTLSSFINQAIPLTIGIFDNHIQRQPSSLVIDVIKAKKLHSTLITINNPAGTITRQASRAIIKAGTAPTYLSVVGEEDLLVIPLILSKPLDSVIFYGQPNQGIVMIKITETLKDQICQLLTLDR